MIFDCPECGHTLEHVGICDYYCEWCDDTYDIEELLPPVFDVVDDETAQTAPAARPARPKAAKAKE